MKQISTIYQVKAYDLGIINFNQVVHSADKINIQ